MLEEITVDNKTKARLQMVKVGVLNMNNWILQCSVGI